MEIVSGSLTGTQIVEEVPAIVDLFRQIGDDSLLVEYGWGSRLDMDQLWKDFRVDLADLVVRVQEIAEAGIFQPGSSDLIIQNDSRTVTFRLCHEPDIHVTTANLFIIQQVVNRWRSNGYGGFKSDAAGTWRPIVPGG